MISRILTVTQLNRYIKTMLENDALLSNVLAEGEISNYKRHSSGHLYFTLKDESSTINAVMFYSAASSMRFEPYNGMKAFVSGRVSLYEKTGQYQIYAEKIEPCGIGGLQLAFVKLCEKLKAEGLFDEKNKKPLPLFLRCVAVITSPTGAALRDICSTIRARNPSVKIVLAPSLVQGSNAAEDIARAINAVNSWGGADLIILSRGGGSAEDLWAFNEEAAVRAVAASKLPIISAVGHETDFTAADFAADCRAATPTAAAVIAVREKEEITAFLKHINNIFVKSVKKIFDGYRYDYLRLVSKRCFKHPLESIYQKQIYLHDTSRRLVKQAEGYVSKKKLLMSSYEKLLDKLSPQSVWKRGFVMARNDGKKIFSVYDAKPGDILVLECSDGQIDTAVKKINTAVSGV
ncbi:MAG: exodeoxyribonuclease VII large subunit [Defluviitaleaceae bacterium]|nr:exodeoxyribonuclease VII large subunit [Defluviitaleaceae bacterium]